MLTYASLCSGIEAISVAWRGLPLSPLFFAENAEFPSAVLAHHYPRVPNYGDITRMDGHIARLSGRRFRRYVDVLWGSFPCQDFSVGGSRAGLNGARGALTLSGVNLVNDIDPEIFCFENVDGILKDKTNAFGALLGALAGESEPLVPTGARWTDAGRVSGPRRRIAWRVFDAKYAGLAQQRRRVFLVASRQEGSLSPSEILFESRPAPKAPRPPKNFSVRAVAIRGREEGQRLEVGGNISNCLRASQGGSDKAFIQTHSGAIRLLMPDECETLMGLPKHYTRIPWRGGDAKECPDGLRYHAIGNSVSVPDVRWIGKRIVDQFLEKMPGSIRWH